MKPWHAELERAIRKANREGLAPGEVREIELEGGVVDDPRSVIHPMHTVNAADFCGAPAGRLMLAGACSKRGRPALYFFSYRPEPPWNTLLVEGELVPAKIWPATDFGAIP